MARTRKEKDIKMKLSQPDRTPLDPTRQTLLDLAQERGLLNHPQNTTSNSPADQEPLIGRFGESVFWSISLTMLHFTLDVLVAHQYAVEILWGKLVMRTVQAFPLILLLFYSFHDHPTPSPLLPRLPDKIYPYLHTLGFFTSSISAGCYLVYITNTYSYYAVMKQSPPLGCLWIWSVIELDLGWACGSLFVCLGFLKWNDLAFL